MFWGGALHHMPGPYVYKVLGVETSRDSELFSFSDNLVGTDAPKIATTIIPSLIVLTKSSLSFPVSCQPSANHPVKIWASSNT